MENAVCHSRGNDTFAPDIRRQVIGILAPSCVELVQLFELHEPDRRRYIGHAVVVAKTGVEVFLALPVVDDLSEALCECLFARCHHPAFAGDHVLGRIK